MHSAAAVRLVREEYVPAGHGLKVATDVRAGQKEPAAHAPDTAACPPAQYTPGGQSVHSLCCVRFVHGENVPGAQGNCVA